MIRTKHQKVCGKTRGFTMLEAIVAVIITSVGLLGVAALQGTAIGHTKKASDRTIAAAQLANLSSRMKSSQSYWQTIPVDFSITIAADGTIAGGAEGAALQAEVTDCFANSCTDPRAMVAHNLRKWVTDGGNVDTSSGFADRLINPTATITRVDNSIPVQLDVILGWDQKAMTAGFNMAAGHAGISTSNYQIRIQP